MLGDITILNVYSPNYRASIYMEQKLRKLKKLDESVNIDKYFSTLLCVIVRVNRHNISKYIDLNNTINY